LLVRSYLDRIGIEKIEDPSRKYLAELQNHHLRSIPFEDLDIPGKRIELDLEKIYNKIISTKRGGFCYELNGLFHWLLASLDFKVDMLSARVFNSKKNEFGPEFDHMTLIVHLDKDYLVDVGFGDSFRIPLEFPKGEVEDISGHYQLKQHETSSIHNFINEKAFELLRENENDWIPQYLFTLKPREFNDYKDMCDFQQDSPASHFRTRMLCTIATEEGRITLSNDSLTIKEDKTKNKISFESKEEFNAYLKNYFDIEL